MIKKYAEHYIEVWDEEYQSEKLECTGIEEYEYGEYYKVEDIEKILNMFKEVFEKIIPKHCKNCGLWKKEHFVSMDEMLHRGFTLEEIEKARGNEI